MSSDENGIHEAAVKDFVGRVEEQGTKGVESIYLFGSVARGEARGRDSDADLFVVLSDDVDRTTTQRTLRDIAYEVLLDRDIVVSVRTQSRSRFEARRDHPFNETVLSEGIAYV